MPKQSATPGPHRADERVHRSKETILTTAFQLLMETGLSGVSVDEVSKRSGVAKTTIYRHWPSRTALLLEACAKLGSKFDAPDTGNLRDDLLAIASRIAGRLRSKNYSSVLPSVIDAAERDPQIEALHARIHTGYLGAALRGYRTSQAKG